ncbi:MAG: GTP-binding protein, partial [Akkermansia sp.]|nr:GTP-binding protein [Akkermansia sp.]
ENEYGEVGVDSGFMKDSGIQVTELNSGCICCTLVGDFRLCRYFEEAAQGARPRARWPTGLSTT